ncbi:ion channel [Dorea longicatena]|uniref:ion channel n=1 Tax=Dorea longicatena TaxID=88431 RepID=UPI001FF33362|nr:ion channel [Dorea longicatena]UOX54677.1 potassium channel family protein [Dorea longicatena]
MSILLTVGYGDIYPITTLGRIMAICIAYLGLVLVSLLFLPVLSAPVSLNNISEKAIFPISKIWI